MPFVSAVREIPVEENNKVESVSIEKVDKPLEEAIGNRNKYYREEDLYDLLKNVISCLGHISENYYFGISILMAVLRGENRKQIVKHKLNEAPEFGIYSNMSRDDMRAVVQWMINNHYMLKTKAKYPVLHTTYNGNHFEECITKKQIKDFKNYLENPNREIFDEDDKED